MRLGNVLVLDTETHGVVKKWVYDFAWQVITPQGVILTAENYAVEEIITDPDIMKTAFYHRKIYTDYIPMLDAGHVTLLDWRGIREKFLSDCRQFKVDTIAAYNLAFDMGAIKQTQGKLMSGKFLTEKINILDLWLFSCLTIFRQSCYRKLADTLGWISPAGNYRTTAEHAFRYISGERDFEESHTAAHDVKIECDILAHLIRQKKGVPLNRLDYMPWRLAQV